MPSPTRLRAWIMTLTAGCAIALAALILAGLIQPASAQAPRPAALPRVAPSPHAPTPATAATPSPSSSPTRGSASTATPAPRAPSTNPPSVSPAPPDMPGGSEAPGGCGLLDLGCRAITGFFRAVVSAAMNPVFRLLASSILAAPRVDEMPRVHSLWTTSAWIANTSFILLVIIGGMLVMGHQSLQTSYTAKDIAPRLVVAAVASNANLLVIGPAIEFANALSAALMGEGVDPARAAETLKSLVGAAVTDSSNDVFLPLLAMVAVFAAMAVLFTFVIRLMLLVLLTAAAPLALACHALPQTDGLARLWWLAFAGVMAIQIAQSLVLATALRVFFTSDQSAFFGFRSNQTMLELVLVICLLYLLARIPSWVSHLIMQGGMSRSPLVRIVRTIAALVIFRRLSALTGSRNNQRSGPRRPPAGPALPSTPTPPVPPAGGAPRWVQPELPLEDPPARGEQLQLPLDRPGHPAPQPQAPAVRSVQLRLPGTAARPPRWTQTSLPIRPRYLQTRLPAPPTRPGVQAELPVTFPAPGTPAAGRSPRRLADAAALADAEARSRRAAQNPPRPRSDRRNR